MNLEAKNPPDTGAVLEHRLVGKISGHFVVLGYQRGYRWTKHEVGRLLDDIWSNGDKPYSLQPVVVKRFTDGWELVDGQQRLTTLYLLFLYMQRAGLQAQGPLYTLRYETRPKSEAYLQNIDEEESGRNIDFFHLYGAYDCIRAWFAAKGASRQDVANQLYNYLRDQVRIIWYQAPADLDSVTLFTRLNVGRIALTDAELVKAVLLSRSEGSLARADRAHELAAQWDAIERDLRRPDVWAFITTANADDFPTRITLLLDTIAGGHSDHARPPFHTFDTMRQRMEAETPEAIWEKVVDLHGLVMGWFDDRDVFYHKVGYLVATGVKFGDLVALAEDCAKQAFEGLLDDMIRSNLKLRVSELLGLSYEPKSGREKCSDLLLLMNVETVRCVKGSSERYPFRRHHGARAGEALSWSLEHIHAKQAEGLAKTDDQKEWLRLHREALVELHLENPERRDALVAKIDASIEHVSRPVFDELAREVADFFTLGEDAGSEALYSIHAITNLALLPGKENSVLSNAVFEVKRRRIIELDKKGAFIPVCTRQVFLKYYTEASAQQIDFWGPRDRESYLNAMKDVLKPYWLPEEKPS